MSQTYNIIIYIYIKLGFAQRQNLLKCDHDLIYNDTLTSQYALR